MTATQTSRRMARVLANPAIVGDLRWRAQVVKALEPAPRWSDLPLAMRRRAERIEVMTQMEIDAVIAGEQDAPS